MYSRLDKFEIPDLTTLDFANNEKDGNFYLSFSNIQDKLNERKKFSMNYSYLQEYSPNINYNEYISFIKYSECIKE